VEWFGEEQSLTGKAAYTLRFDHQQRLWAATEAGLFVARAPYRRFSRINELPSTRFWTVGEGTDGTIWAGGAEGLFAYATEATGSEHSSIVTRCHRAARAFS
jgi:ligand-binding sensor domain-containing protein